MAVGQRRVEDSPPPPSVGGLGQWKRQISSGAFLVTLPMASCPYGVVSSYTLYVHKCSVIFPTGVLHITPPLCATSPSVLRMCFWRLRGMSDTRGDTCIGINLHCTTSSTRSEYLFWTRVEKHGVVRRADKCGPYQYSLEKKWWYRAITSGS